jgi:hypothetical protein
MIIRYPFGRGGGGAPIRNKAGEIVTYRKNLISDPKYSHIPINVDDDYDEVWAKEKKFKISNDTNQQFYNPNIYYNSQSQNNNNMNYINQDIIDIEKNNILNNIRILNHSKSVPNFDNIYYRKILERKKKELQYEKEKELDYFHKLKLSRKLRRNCFRIKNNYKTHRKKIFAKDFYDNYNFVPKSKIVPRLDNNFLFSEELTRLRNEMRNEQNSLKKEIISLKDSSIKKDNERHKLIKDMEYVKKEIEKSKSNDEDIEDKVYYKNSEIKKILRDNDKDGYFYINDEFYKKYENELTNKSTFHIEKNLLDMNRKSEQNQIELEELINKNNDIIDKLNEYEKMDKEAQERPGDYFNKSEDYFKQYMKDHINDYKE